MMIEIARTKRNGAKTNMDIAKELKKTDCFKNSRIFEIIETIRSYSKDGLLVVTDEEIILNHNF